MLTKPTVIDEGGITLGKHASRFLWALLPLSLFLTLLLSACHPAPQWYGKGIKNLMPDLKFQLTGMDGKPVTEKTFTGKSVMLYFGYSYCPDVCPATLMRLSQARAALPKDERDKIVILFVSVDPKRDTPKRLKEYTHFFGSGIFGATGTTPQLEAITSRYRTSYSYGKPDKQGNYVVNHGSGIYGFDSKGNIRVLITEDKNIAHLTADMKTLIAL